MAYSFHFNMTVHVEMYLNTHFLINFHSPFFLNWNNMFPFNWKWFLFLTSTSIHLKYVSISFPVGLKFFHVSLSNKQIKQPFYLTNYNLLFKGIASSMFQPVHLKWTLLISLSFRSASWAVKSEIRPCTSFCSPSR